MNKLTNAFEYIYNYFYTSDDLQNKNITAVDIINFLPTEIWDKIFDNCSMNTLLSLRSVNKTWYAYLQKKIVDRHYERESCNHLVYSLDSYKNYIKPQLLQLNKLSLVDEIDNKIATATSEATSELKNDFSKFLFYKLRTSMQEIKKNKQFMQQLALPRAVDMFKLSNCGNYCVILEKYSYYSTTELMVKDVYHFTVWQINITSKLIELQHNAPELNHKLLLIQFTHRNNLLTSNVEDLTLWSLNYDKKTLQLNKLWQHNIFHPYSHFIFSMGISEDEKTFIKLINISTPFIYYVSSETIVSKKLFDILRFKNLVYKPSGKYWEFYYVSANKGLTTLALQSEIFPNYTKIFHKNNNEDIFFEEEIAMAKFNDLGENLSADMHFNSLSNLCIAYTRMGTIIILKKINNIWYPTKIDFEKNSVLYSINFMPHSYNHIFVIKKYGSLYNLEIINIDKLTDKIVAKQDSDFSIFSKNNSHYSTLSSIKDIFVNKEFISMSNEITFHPSWLSVFIFDVIDRKVWVTLPKK